jgi:hypothetical protein
MKLSDFIIIYLACGAPFAVFYFLQHRREKNSLLVYLKTLCLVFVWIPYAIWLLHESVTKYLLKREAVKNSAVGTLENFEKGFSKFVFETDGEISVFDFREVFERYTGLTLAKNSAESIPPKSSEEIFRVALRQNIKLGAQCLHRRNLKRIESHQDGARHDFVNLVFDLKQIVPETEELGKLSFELVKFLNDDQAAEDLRKVYAWNLQNETACPVGQTGEDLWTTGEHKQSTANRVPLHL